MMWSVFLFVLLFFRIEPHITSARLTVFMALTRTTPDSTLCLGVGKLADARVRRYDTYLGQDHGFSCCVFVCDVIVGLKIETLSTGVIFCCLSLPCLTFNSPASSPTPKEGAAPSLLATVFSRT